MASMAMDAETPNVTADWRESCKRAIIPEVWLIVTVYYASYS